MEEILSSIRKIIRSDEDDGQAPSAPRGDNVLDLTEMVREDGTVAQLDPAREPLSLNEVDIVDVEQPSVASILSGLQSARDAIDAKEGRSDSEGRPPDSAPGDLGPHDQSPDPSPESPGKTIDLDASDIVETGDADAPDAIDAPATTPVSGADPVSDAVEPRPPASGRPSGSKRKRGILGVYRKTKPAEVDADTDAVPTSESDKQDATVRPSLHAVPSPESQPDPLAESMTEAGGDGLSGDREPAPESVAVPPVVTIVPEDASQPPHGEDPRAEEVEHPFQDEQDQLAPAPPASPPYGAEPVPATFVVEKTVEEILAEAAAEDAERTLASLAGAGPPARTEETTAGAYTLSLDEALVEDEPEEEPPVSRQPEPTRAEGPTGEVVDYAHSEDDEAHTTAPPEPSVVRADRPSDAGLATAVRDSGSIGALDAEQTEPTTGDGSEGELGMEQMVRDALVPVLKEYLDENLKPVIERIVREETRKILLGRKAK